MSQDNTTILCRKCGADGTHRCSMPGCPLPPLKDTEAQSNTTKCHRCGGAGRLRIDEPESNGGQISAVCDRCGGSGRTSSTTIGGYPANIDNPDDWAAFLARYLDNRATNAVHNGIGLVALHIVDAIRDARAAALKDRA